MSHFVENHGGLFAGRVCGEFAEVYVFYTAADNMDNVDFSAENFFERLNIITIGKSETFEYAESRLPLAFRRFLVRPYKEATKLTSNDVKPTAGVK